MSDLIDREEAIAALIYADVALDGYSADTALRVIKAVPSADRWTPVSEALPEEGDDVLFCDEHGNRFCGSYRGVSFNTNEDAFEDDYGYDRECVVAWMPLPPVYQGK